MILKSHYITFGKKILDSEDLTGSSLEQNKKIFTFKNPIIAHGIGEEPCLIYVNKAALTLWERTWEEMIGMPSSLTAPPEERKKLKYALNIVIQLAILKSNKMN